MATSGELRFHKRGKNLNLSIFFRSSNIPPILLILGVFNVLNLFSKSIKKNVK